jgi:hypothetical protein
MLIGTKSSHDFTIEVATLVPDVVCYPNVYHSEALGYFYE